MYDGKGVSVNAWDCKHIRDKAPDSEDPSRWRWFPVRRRDPSDTHEMAGFALPLIP